MYNFICFAFEIYYIKKKKYVSLKTELKVINDLFTRTAVWKKLLSGPK